MGKRLAALALSGFALVALVGSAAADQDSRGGGEQAKPLIFGHRGASGYRPEHTLASYELAARMGADYIEPDLVSTKDGVLVARHENEIGGTTDVASHPEFTGRKTTKIIDGSPLTGWFTEDFTLAELKTLRATERIPDIRQRNTIYNKRFEVPTFQEVIDLTKRLSWELKRDIGIAPETKHPTYFQSIGKPLEPALIRTLDRNGLNKPQAKVVVQSFEVSNLVSLNRSLRVQLVQLTSATGAPYDFIAKGDKRTYADIVSPAGLREVAKYADWLGPEKAQIIPRDAAGFLQAPTSLVSDSHKAGLKVVPYTFRNENSFLPADFRSSAVAAEYGNAIGEFEKFFATGIDGIFTDNTDTGVEARKATGH
ncbi:glycerophosphodiester phosphodiesterase [Kibdelosporangium philippinense]|uniref:glycerophosphodiester phosphodiesterase n=1 Tax=Kibdelosporangium philippinense TaxID=211113 RepID=A0ABS8ZFJ8_9PSEU|nr:glycerophosphodiester phosphodiesterase [Kibdelosporangium philippinense]MCE7005298.1 glycerophosphodiester phosphodiesterase [Kibdelosporangium philippinense]